MDFLLEEELQGTAAALLLVFGLLDKRVDIPRCAQVCREWRRATCNRHLWQSLSLANATDAGTRLSYIVSQPRFLGLKELDLTFAQGVEDEHVRQLAGLQSLEGLNLDACQNVGEDAIISLVESSSGPVLKSLSFYWNLKMKDRTLKAISRHCSQLTHLNLSGCKHVTDEGVSHLALGLPNLVRLNLTRCPLVKDAALSAVVQAHPALDELLLYANAGLTDTFFKVLGCLTQVVHLDLCGMQFMSDEGLAVVAACTNLSILNLSWCINISDVGICPVALACPHLTNLSVYGVRGMTDALIISLAQSCRDALHTLDVRGCLGIKGRAPEDLVLSLPKLTCFIVHS